MEKTKVTKKEMYEIIKGVCANREDIINFCNHEIELLSKKTQGSKATKNQVENESTKAIILEVLNGQEKMTIDEIRALDERIGQYSNQRISAIVRQLIEDKLIVRTQEGRKALFELTK